LALASAAQQRAFQFDDKIIYGNASGTALEVNKGDWVMASGHHVIAATTADTNIYVVSGLGIALANNPTYDVLGNARVVTALPIATRGIFRVSGISAVSASALIGSWVMPGATASGIIGQTGATGMAGRWQTATIADASGFTGGHYGSGVARIVNVVKIGSTAQWDIEIRPGQVAMFLAT